MSRFSRLPGISDNGGYKNYIVGFFYIIVILGVLGAVAPPADDDTTQQAAPTTTIAPDTTAAPDRTESPETDADTPTSEGATEAQTTTVTSTATPTSTTVQTTAATTSAPAQDGESYSYSGSGNDVTDSFSTEGGLVVFDFEHSGESNFQVQAVSPDDEHFLVNGIGDYDGHVALYMPAGDWQLDVTADGSWSTDITQPRYNENDIKELPASGDDQHAAYFGPFQFEGTTEVSFEIENDAQAAVWLARTNGEKVELLHNEIGPYQGSALTRQEGVGLIIVDTDSADWRIEIGG